MAIEKLTYKDIEDSSTSMKTCNSNMSDFLQKAASKMNSINDPEVWASPNAEMMRERFNELSVKFPGFTESINGFAAFLDIVAKTNKEDAEKNAREQDEAIGSSGD